MPDRSSFSQSVLCWSLTLLLHWLPIWLQVLRTDSAEPVTTPSAKRQKVAISDACIKKHDIKPLNHRVNFDLALAFVRRMRSLTLHGEPRRSRIVLLYHWTLADNFDSIERSNLLVPQSKIWPQGHKVANGSLHGRGIYTAPDIVTGSNYGKGAGECFLCLGLPGRQYRTKQADLDSLLKSGYDSHLAGWGEWKDRALVLFSSDQLLPCFLVKQSDHQEAAIRAQKVADYLSTAILNIPEDEAARQLEKERFSMQCPLM